MLIFGSGRIAFDKSTQTIYVVDHDQIAPTGTGLTLFANASLSGFSIPRSALNVVFRIRRTVMHTYNVDANMRTLVWFEVNLEIRETDLHPNRQSKTRGTVFGVLGG